MTRSVYVLGGAGTGKSTFMAALLRVVGPCEPEVIDFLGLRNAKALVTFRGHRLASGGVYLGLMRDSFPGTDGLDRASSPTGEAWLRAGNLPAIIVAEGATLSTTRFLTALHETTDLLVVHLQATMGVKIDRFNERGSYQKLSFVEGSATRAANRARDLTQRGARVLDIDSDDRGSWDLALDLAETFLTKP